MKLSRMLVCCTIFTLTAAVAKAQTVSAPSTDGSDSSASCAKSLLVNFETTRHDGTPGPEIPIWQIEGNSAFFFETGMAIDADGAPNAYNPDDTGLDDLENAGQPGDWWALALDENGEPYVQGAQDPFPGYYISTTALADRTKGRTDPGRYVDASRIPFIVLPNSVIQQTGARLGDLAVVFNRHNGKMSYAIFADVGPSVGEGSVALADSLDVRSSPRRGGARDGIVYMVFPGSGNGQPKPIEDINENAAKLLEDSASAPIKACTIN